MPPDSHWKAGDRERRKSPFSSVCETRPYTYTGVLPARVLSRVETVTPPRSKVTSQTGCVEIGQTAKRAHVIVANFNDEPLTIPKCTATGVAESVSENVVNLVNSGEQTVAKLPTIPESTIIGISEPVSEAAVNLEKPGGQSGAKSPTVPRRKRRNLRPLWNLNNTLETRLWYFHQILPRLDHRRDVLDLGRIALKSSFSVATGLDLHPPTIHPNHLNPERNCRIQESNPRPPGQEQGRFRTCRLVKNKLDLRYLH